MESKNSQEMNEISGNSEQNQENLAANVHFDGGDETANASPSQDLRNEPLAYPPFPGDASGLFPPPGLPQSFPAPGFNPQADTFQVNDHAATSAQSQAFHQPQPPMPVNPGPSFMPDGESQVLNFQAAAELKKYFEFLFGSPSFSDVRIKIMERAQSADPVEFDAHRIVLARSPKLRELAAQDTDVITINIEGKYLSTYSFVQVLRYLYGGAMPTRRSFAGENSMQQTLSLAATGHSCELPEVVFQALDYATTYVTWSNVEQALAFALEGGLTAAFHFEEYENVPEPRYGNHAGTFLRCIVDWLVNNMPAKFQFDSGAPQLVESPRLPGILEMRPSVADPRLSRIRFGDLPSEESSQSTTLLSSIMLSLPIGVLRYLLQHPVLWARPGISGMAQKIIKERENRRKKALESKRHVPGATEYMREAMYWEESCLSMGNHAQGFTLVRECLKTTVGGLGGNQARGGHGGS